MTTGMVPGFRPSLCGFHFANFFPRQPVVRVALPGLGTLDVGDASRGLCGGMAFAARDLFEARRLPPSHVEPPALGSPWYRYFVRRLFDSFDLPRGPLKYFRWMNRSDRAVRLRTASHEWPRVRAELDHGRLAPLGLVKLHSANPLRMGENHQVLAYGYDLDEATGALRLHVYDPNHPDDDAVTLSLNLDRAALDPVVYSTGAAVRGFFHTRYRGKPSLTRLDGA